MESVGPIILFDGVCNLCSTSVHRIIDNEKKPYYQFASLQSNLGQDLLTKFGKDPKLLDSIVLIENGKLYQKSRAIFRICKTLKMPYPLIYIFWPVPFFLRDWVYNWVARNRYKWYGKKNECWLPSPELKERFLG